VVTFCELLRRISHIKIISVLSFVIPYIFNLWLKEPVLDMFRELQLIEDTVSGKFQLLFIGVLTQSSSKSKHRYKLERETGALFWPHLIILAVGPKARGDILNSYRITGLHAHLCRGGGGDIYGNRIFKDTFLSLLGQLFSQPVSQLLLPGGGGLKSTISIT
jgi:hypothetical protein